VLYTTERDAARNLEREGIAAERVVFAGNVMIDALLTHKARAHAPRSTLLNAGVDASLIDGGEGFGVVTLHRPSNVDEPDAFGEAVELLCDVARRIPLVWPVHPRARANLVRFGLADTLARAPIALLEPQGYLEMLGLLANARVVLTDSGGIQEETTALAVPCLTMRGNTERPITIVQGTNTLVGRDRARALACVEEILASGGKRGHVPELWDGQAATRIAAHLAGWLAARRVRMGAV
jgi:UDP-N-acetylglucosamine 2-epimerase (non-hydrolysing)